MNFCFVRNEGKRFRSLLAVKLSSFPATLQSLPPYVCAKIEKLYLKRQKGLKEVFNIIDCVTSRSVIKKTTSGIILMGKFRLYEYFTWGEVRVFRRSFPFWILDIPISNIPSIRLTKFPHYSLQDSSKKITRKLKEQRKVLPTRSKREKGGEKTIWWLLNSVFLSICFS